MYTTISMYKQHSVRPSSYLVCREFMFYQCYLYLFTYTDVQHNLHVGCCSSRLTVTRRVSHVKQELLTLPENLSSPPGL